MNPQSSNPFKRKDESRIFNPLVSIVINNYNYENYVGKAIESSLSQSYDPVEVVVVDDGSTDGSWEIINSYGEQITTLQKTNGGQGSAINLGFKLSRGDWVVFLDADDYLAETAIEEITARDLDGVSKVQFVLNVVDSNGSSIGITLPNRKMSRYSPRSMVEAAGYYVSPPSSGNIYSRSFLDIILPMDSDRWRISADAYLLLAAPFHGRVLSVERILGFYRRHGSGASDISAQNIDLLSKYVFKELKKERNRVSWSSELCIQNEKSLKRKSRHFITPTLVKYLVLESRIVRKPLVERSTLILHILKASFTWKDYSLFERIRLVTWGLLCLFLPTETAIELAAKTIHPHLRNP